MTAILRRDRPRVTAPRSPRAGRRLAYLLILPALCVVAVGLGYPLARQVVMSFQEFGLQQQFGQAPVFIGLANYLTVLTDTTFWEVLGRSLAFCFACAAATVVVGTAGAMLLTQVSRPIAVGVQIIMLVAWAMPVLSSLQVFQWLFDPRSGVIGWTLGQLGLDGMVGYNWLSDPLTFFIVAGLLITWMGVPLVVFLVYASVTQLDESMIEAAQLDGAGGWKRFRHIVAPSIAPVLLLVSLLQVIWDLRVFTQIYILQQNSGISEQTNVLGTFVYQIGLSGGNYGLASAAAMIMLAVSLLLCWRYITALLRQGDDL
ncbi:MAG: sugar ABC transporter permease [Burkholderiaceae bacterium]|nr:sugar ABC transporter permease [Microbacteriaceae bacterium]